MTVMELIEIVSFVILLLSTGITIGRYIEKLSNKENKNDRPKQSHKLGRSFLSTG